MDSMLLKEEALKLSPAERVWLLDALWKSLDSAEQPGVDRAWISESLDRLRAFQEGRLDASNAEEVLGEIERDLRDH